MADELCPACGGAHVTPEQITHWAAARRTVTFEGRTLNSLAALIHCLTQETTHE